MTDLRTTDWGLTTGAIELASVGPIAFGPDGVLFIADNAGCRIVAVDVGDDGVVTGDTQPFDLAEVEQEVGAFLGCAPDDVKIRDVEVHPRSHNVYLAVTRGRGDDALQLIVRIDRDATISEVALRDVRCSSFTLADAPDETKTLWGGRRQ